MTAEAKTVRQVRIPEDLHTRILRAAAREQEETGERVSVVGWIRQAIEMRLCDVEHDHARRVPLAGREAGR